MNETRLYLLYILESIEAIERFTADGEQAFTASEVIQAAVLYRLHTLAEATQQLPDELKARYPEVEWEQIRGFRNRLVHGYLIINLGLVWQIVQADLPPLKQVIRQILATLGSE